MHTNCMVQSSELILNDKAVPIPLHSAEAKKPADSKRLIKIN